jgi:ATP-dependent exoDNAse (exonuclease V) alpha subunit
MYLAGILGLCALLLSPALGTGSGRAFFLSSQQAAPVSPTPSSQGQTPSTPATDQSPAEQQTSDTKKPAPTKKKTRRKKAAPSASEDPQKTVVRKGGTGDTTVQLAPAMNAAEASRQREATKQLLTSTDANLQKLSERQLSKDEQDTVAQIREFMQQAKTADSKGDLERASKLASKAHLLSEALAKP